MSGLVTTLRTLLGQADAHFAAGRLAAARATYEELLERSQERGDRGMEVIARAMLARWALRRRDTEAAREHLDQARDRLDPSHREAHGRWRAADAHLALTEDREAGRERLRDWLRWAEQVEVWDGAVEACRLLADGRPADERASWLQRAVDLASEHDLDAILPIVYGELAAALDELGRAEEALSAWDHALDGHRRGGAPRAIASCAWAAGAIACRLEDWPLAQERLDEAIRAASDTEDARDLLALALADSARVHDASGDVIEARRVMLRALAIAREEDLARVWPERWAAMREQARRLELDA